MPRSGTCTYCIVQLFCCQFKRLLGGLLLARESGRRHHMLQLVERWSNAAETLSWLVCVACLSINHSDFYNACSLPALPTEFPVFKQVFFLSLSQKCLQRKEIPLPKGFLPPSFWKIWFGFSRLHLHLEVQRMVFPVRRKPVVSRNLFALRTYNQQSSFALL